LQCDQVSNTSIILTALFVYIYLLSSVCHHVIGLLCFFRYYLLVKLVFSFCPASIISGVLLQVRPDPRTTNWSGFVTGWITSGQS